MTCLEFQGMITRFISGELSKKETEQFMEHVLSCENCKEELEVYYIILTSIKQIDQDKEMSDDFHQEFLNVLKSTEEEIIARRRRHTRRRAAFTIMVGAVTLFLGISFGSTNPEQEELEKGAPIKSHFELKFRFLEERHCFFKRLTPEPSDDGTSLEEWKMEK